MAGLNSCNDIKERRYKSNLRANFCLKTAFTWIYQTNHIAAKHQNISTFQSG